MSESDAVSAATEFCQMGGRRETRGKTPTGFQSPTTITLRQTLATRINSCSRVGGCLTFVPADELATAPSSLLATKRPVVVLVPRAESQLITITTIIIIIMIFTQSTWPRDLDA